MPRRSGQYEKECVQSKKYTIIESESIMNHYYVGEEINMIMLTIAGTLIYHLVL